MSIKKLLVLAALALALASVPALAQATKTQPAAPLVAMPSFAPIVEKVESAVVFIEVTQTIKGRPGRNPYGPPEDLFDHFFGAPPQGDQKARGQGSGFIFDPEGHVITNNHVIENAEKITVKLSNGEKIEAELIGRDPKIDVALLKIKKPGPYPFLTLGDSANLKTGDWVVAIGNPLGLDHTVTAGIVSARNRSINMGPYDDFIQTDAAINQGNSGGPLLNLSGEVIGINALIASPGAGGNVGIGFAIPTNLAKGVVAQLKEKGRVIRGWLGVGIQEVTKEMAKGFGLGEARGALIREVIDPSGPAAAAKIQTGDIILNFDGKDIKNPQDLSLTVANTEVGKKVKVIIFRDKKEITIDLVVAEQPADVAGPGSAAPAAASKLGLTVQEITPELIARNKISEQEGVFITEVAPDSPAAEAGLMAGDVIIKINSETVKNMRDYRKAIADKKPEEVVVFLVKRGPGTFFFSVTVAE